MRCLNSPPALNSLEARIVETVPQDAKHVLVVNAGDGRLARALRARVTPDAAVSVVVVYPEQRRFLDDFEAVGTEPWDAEWYPEKVAQHGQFDFVVFYQLQEFWRGELHGLQRILRLAKPRTLAWVSFINAQASRMAARYLPPVQLGFSSLADPLRTSASVDYASVVDFVGRSGGSIAELWGMLDSAAQEFCQKPPTKPVQWDLRGVKINIATFADAFLWGAAAVGIGFKVSGGDVQPTTPRVSYSPYSPQLLQALAVPYPDFQAQEGVLAAAEFELAASREATTPPQLGHLARTFLEQAGAAETSRRVLLVGSGWGRDLLLLKRHYPSWEWTGFDYNGELVEIGREYLEQHGINTVVAEHGARLPIADRAFDLVVSLGYFSVLFEPAARALAKELRRVCRGPIFHLEDGRGPEHGLQLKAYSLKAIYSELGADSTVQPVLVDGSPIGMYMLKVAAPA